jgi:signal transduction histidine kinase
LKDDLEKKKITLQFHPTNHQEIYVLVDETSFKSQVLGNIFSNAMRFSDPESTIYIDSYPVAPDLIAIEIRDEGIGIPMTLKDHLFDLNKKTTRPGTQGDTGTGLGLHIVRAFIEAYAGEITVMSQERATETPSGTTVKLILQGEMRSP